MLSLLTVSAFSGCSEYNYLSDSAFTLSKDETRCFNSFELYIRSNKQEFTISQADDEPITVGASASYQGIFATESIEDSMTITCKADSCDFITASSAIPKGVITQKAKNLVLSYQDEIYTEPTEYDTTEFGMLYAKTTGEVHIKTTTDMEITIFALNSLPPEKPEKIEANTPKTYTSFTNGFYLVVFNSNKGEITINVDDPTPSDEDFGPKVFTYKKGFTAIKDLKGFVHFGSDSGSGSGDGSGSGSDNEDDKITKEEIATFEKYYGSCKIPLTITIPDMQYVRLEVPKGERLCGVHGFIIGSKQKYTVKVNDIANANLSNFPDFNESISKIEFSTKPYTYKNPTVVPRMKWNIFSVECDSSNNQNCTFDILGFHQNDKAIFLINRDDKEYTWKPDHGLLKSSDLFSYWNKKPKTLTFSATEEYKLSAKNGEFAEKQTSDRTFKTTAERGNTFIITESDVKEVPITIEDTKTSAADESTDDIAIPPMLGRLPKTTTSYALSANEVNKEYQNPGSYNPDNSEVRVKDDEDDDGLSGGAIAGIVIGVIVVVVIIVVLIWLLVFRKKGSKDSSSSSSSSSKKKEDQ